MRIGLHKLKAVRRIEESNMMNQNTIKLNHGKIRWLIYPTFVILVGIILYYKDRIITEKHILTMENVRRSEITRITCLINLALTIYGYNVYSTITYDMEQTELPDSIVSVLRECHKGKEQGSDDTDFMSKLFAIPKTRIHDRVLLDPWGNPYHFTFVRIPSTSHSEEASPLIRVLVTPSEKSEKVKK